MIECFVPWHRGHSIKMPLQTTYICVRYLYMLQYDIYVRVFFLFTGSKCIGIILSFPLPTDTHKLYVTLGGSSLLSAV